MAATPKSKKAKKDEAPAADSAKAAEPYVVYARRFRPQSFADVAGQSAVTNALKQALASGRVAQAYMLCGPRGVGKTSLARIFAKACNCKRGTGPGGAAEEPCNECEACVSIQNGSSLDVIEMDAATNRGIEEIRDLRESVTIAPAELKYKVYIIDEVHMLTREAWNAFLKTLEEPPAHVKFIFATTDPNDVPETILSRCQRFDLRRINLNDIVKRLRKICEADKLEFEEAALSRIASLAKGGLRDAEGMLDQAVNLGGGKVTDTIVRELSGAAPDELLFEMLHACAAGNAAEALAKSHAALEAGADPDDLLAALSERLRGTMMSRICGGDSPLLEGQTHLKDSFAKLSQALNEEQCLMLIQLFTQARRQMRDAAQTRLPLEAALIRAARAKDLVDLSKLTSMLEARAAAAPPGANRPPGAEGARPNSQGRPATEQSRPAAQPPVRSAPTQSAPLPRTAPAAKPLPPIPAATPARRDDQYVDEGSLPLPEPIPDIPEESGGFDAGDDVPPVQPRTVPPPIPKVAAPARRMEIDSKIVEQHPLVQLVLKETGGLLIDVTRARAIEDKEK